MQAIHRLHHYWLRPASKPRKQLRKDLPKRQGDAPNPYVHRQQQRRRGQQEGPKLRDRGARILYEP